MSEPERHIKEEMVESTEKTIQAFPEEHNLVTNIGGLYIEVMLLIEKLKKISRCSEIAVFGAGTRNFRLLQCASHAIYNGFYDVCLILLRVVYENNLLIRYLTDNEEEAKRWLKGKKYKPSYLRMKAGDKTSIYGFFSDYFTHANVESHFSGVSARINGKTLSADFFPKFDKEYTKICFYLHILIGWMSLIHLQYAFRDSMWKNEEWRNRFAEWNELILDYVERKVKRIKTDR